jgi:hypothetical protein
VIVWVLFYPAAALGTLQAGLPLDFFAAHVSPTQKEDISEREIMRAFNNKIHGP